MRNMRRKGEGTIQAGGEQAMRGFDKEFQKQVEEYMENPPGTANQRTEKDRHDKMEKRETRLDSNNR
jgi:hypothetical protein